METQGEVVPAQENQIVEFSQFESDLIEFKDKYDSVVYDLDDPAQDKQARSDRLSIGKVVSRLDTKHKTLKAPLKAQTDLLDAERKRIKDGLLDVQGKIKHQIAEHERKIQEHAEMLQEKVEAVEAFGLADFDQTNAFRLKDDIEKLESIEIDDSYGHRKADATLAKIDAIKKLNLMLEKAIKREAEQAELERLRKESEEREQAEREQKIADDARIAAEEAAKAEREQLELDKANAQEAAKRAEQDKIEALAKAASDKKEAEERAEIEKAEAIKREQKAAQDREDARIAAEETAKLQEKQEAEKREANKRHSAKINNEALECFIGGGMDADSAKLAVTLIAKREIDHVSIKY